jgi:hypothetical protein
MCRLPRFHIHPSGLDMPFTKQPSRLYLLIPTALAVMLAAVACGGDQQPASAPPPLPSGRWIAGDLHTHTTQSADADVSQTLDKILAKAFTSYGLDWMAVSNHLRLSTRDEKGTALDARFHCRPASSATRFRASRPCRPPAPMPTN